MITVQDLLRLPELQKVLIRAGKSGLARKIRWTHIIDHIDISHFLEGEELLLSSGQVWPKDKESEEKFLYSLLRHQISGILIATGRYLTSCPPALLEFGEKYSIPVLEVPFQVPFVKLTYGIHQQIMEHDYNLKALINQLPPKISKLMQTVDNNKDVCRFLADCLNYSVVFTDPANNILENTTPLNEKQINIKKEIEKIVIRLKNVQTHDIYHNNATDQGIYTIFLNSHHSYVTAVPLYIGEDAYGTLWLFHNDEQLPEENILILKHAGQILIDLYINEQEQKVKRWQLQAEVLDLLIEKQETASLVIEEKFQEIGLESKGKWMAGLILTGNIDLPPRTLLELATYRSVCKNWLKEEREIDGFCEVYNDKLVLLITTSLDSLNLKERLDILSSSLLEINDKISPVFIIGNAEQELLSFVSSFESADLLAPIVQYRNHLGGTYFADEFRSEILLYGKMSPADAHNLLNKLLPDKMLFEDGEILYETLKCLALNSFNRENVAKTLHIHRNTLRYRIKKIEDLLQDNLSSPDCQFWIQTALNIQSLSHHHRS